jgi:hypothetical protein
MGMAATVMVNVSGDSTGMCGTLPKMEDLCADPLKDVQRQDGNCDEMSDKAHSPSQMFRVWLDMFQVPTSPEVVIMFVTKMQVNMFIVSQRIFRIETAAALIGWKSCERFPLGKTMSSYFARCPFACLSVRRSIRTFHLAR